MMASDESEELTKKFPFLKPPSLTAEFGWTASITPEIRSILKKFSPSERFRSCRLSSSDGVATLKRGSKYLQSGKIRSVLMTIQNNRPQEEGGVPACFVHAEVDHSYSPAGSKPHVVKAAISGYSEANIDYTSCDCTAGYDPLILSYFLLHKQQN